MTTNIDRAAEVLWLPEPHLSTSECDDQARELAQALADAGLLTTTPTIIRTVEELEALDPDTLLIRSAQDWADPQIPMLATEWASDWEIEPDRIFPLAIIAPGEQVRAAHKALEKETE